MHRHIAAVLLLLPACTIPQVASDVTCEGSRCVVDWTPPEDMDAGIDRISVWRETEDGRASETLWAATAVPLGSHAIQPGVVLGDPPAGGTTDDELGEFLLESGQTYDLSFERFKDGTEDDDIPKYAFGAVTQFTVP